MWIICLKAFECSSIIAPDYSIAKMNASIIKKLGTIFNFLRQTIVERSMKKNVCVTASLAAQQKVINMVNQLYFNKFKKIKAMCKY